MVFCFTGHLLLTIWTADSVTNCPQACYNSCKYSKAGEIIEAKCSDVIIQSLPNSLIRLWVSDATSASTLPLGLLANFVLHGKVDLKILKMENYHVTTLAGQCFLDVSTLKSLDLSKNDILQIREDNFVGLTDLVFLSLNRNKLQSIGAFSFKELTSLTELNIAVNFIAALGEHDFAGLTQVRKIDLQSNVISSIHPNAFRNLSTVEKVILKNNRLTTIEAHVFQNLANLGTINLQNNSIHALEPTSMRGANLVELNLVQNKLTEIPTKFLQGISSLRLTVNLAGNNISEIPANALNGVTLGTLFLVSNMLRKIHPDALNNSFIRMLDLQQNSLHHIPEGLKKDINQSNLVLLSNNPWSCDCSIQWVRSLLNSTNQEPVCAEPVSYFGYLLSEVLKDLDISCGQPHRPLPAPSKALPVPPKQNPITPRKKTTTPQITTTNASVQSTSVSAEKSTPRHSEVSGDNEKGDNSNVSGIVIGTIAGVAVLCVVILMLLKHFLVKVKVLPDPTMAVSRPDLNHKQQLKYQRMSSVWSIEA